MRSISYKVVAYTRHSLIVVNQANKTQVWSSTVNILNFLKLIDLGKLVLNMFEGNGNFKQVIVLAVLCLVGVFSQTIPPDVELLSVNGQEPSLGRPHSGVGRAVAPQEGGFPFQSSPYRQFDILPHVSPTPFVKKIEMKKERDERRMRERRKKNEREREKTKRRILSFLIFFFYLYFCLFLL